MTQKTFEIAGARITAYLDEPPWDGAPTVTLGAFSCKTSLAGADVLDQAISCLRGTGT